MRVVERWVEGKLRRAELCEDGLVVTPSFAAVVDGSTSKVGRRGGLLAMQLVCRAIERLPAAATLEEVLARLTAAVAQHTPPEAAADPAYRLTCSAAIYSRERREVWLVGDCQCRTGGQTFTNRKQVDAVLATIRADVLRGLLAQGADVEALRRTDPGRAAIMDALRLQTHFQNDANAANPFRYAVIDGQRVDPALVRRVSVEPGRLLVLASDGYPVLCNTLAESEEALHRLLSEDPLCIGQCCSTKGWMEAGASFDDRAFLSLEA